MWIFSWFDYHQYLAKSLLWATGTRYYLMLWSTFHWPEHLAIKGGKYLLRVNASEVSIEKTDSVLLRGYKKGGLVVWQYDKPHAYQEHWPQIQQLKITARTYEYKLMIAWPGVCHQCSSSKILRAPAWCNVLMCVWAHVCLGSCGRWLSTGVCCGGCDAGTLWILGWPKVVSGDICGPLRTQLA